MLPLQNAHQQSHSVEQQGLETAERSVSVLSILGDLGLDSVVQSRTFHHLCCRPPKCLTASPSGGVHCGLGEGLSEKCLHGSRHTVELTSVGFVTGVGLLLLIRPHERSCREWLV